MIGRPRIYSDAERIVRRKESQRLRDARYTAKMTEEQKERARAADRAYRARRGPRTAEQKKADTERQTRYRQRAYADPIKNADFRAKVAARNKAYVLSPDQKAAVTERSKKWYAENKERKHTKQQEWNAKHPEAARIYAHRRRAQKRQADSKFSRHLVQKLMTLQVGRCAACRRSFGARLQYEIDHIMPLALGGSDGDDNAQLLCRKCNRSKHAKHPVDFMQALGFLL